MLISGLVKNSFSDYPGKLAAVIFLPRCNMSCPWCHNKHILSGKIPIIAEDEVFSFLRARRGDIDGVVVSGGEPTLSGSLLSFLGKIKALGYPIKLDTNGTRPDILKQALSRGRKQAPEEGLVDYIAMDIKGPLAKYGMLCGFSDSAAIAESIEIVKSSGLPYEFRTTADPRLDEEDFFEAARAIAPLNGNGVYYIQPYRPTESFTMLPRPPSFLQTVADRIIKELHIECRVR
jgi:pyruvate formate lyase activating enzyme